MVTPSKETIDYLECNHCGGYAIQSDVRGYTTLQQACRDREGNPTAKFHGPATAELARRAAKGGKT